MRRMIEERLKAAKRRARRSDYDLDAALQAPLGRKSMPRDAAVLVPIVGHPGGATVLLTRRTDHLPDHPGQVSFPGGTCRPDDADSVATALREAREEVGIPHHHVDIVGRLDPYETITGFLIEPIVGWVEPGFEIVPDPHEVADVFEVPLDFILDPANLQRHSRAFRGATRHFYALPYRGFYIWGATAHMLVNLSHVLREGAPIEGAT